MPKPQNKLDVVIIATIRPELLEITLNTFYHKLLSRYDVRAIVNVDPAGEKHWTQQDIVALCKKYFPNAVTRTPSRASFGRAVEWCWREVQTDFFFHLEDDWCLTHAIDADKLFAPFADENVVEVRLNRKGVRSGHDSKLSLNPCVMRTSYINHLLACYQFDMDPEAQFSRKQRSPAFPGFPRPRFPAYDNDAVRVIDTGTWWRKVHSMHKDEIAPSSWSGIWTYKKQNTFKLLSRRIRYRFRLWWWRLRYCRGVSARFRARRNPAK